MIYLPVPRRVVLFNYVTDVSECATVMEFLVLCLPAIEGWLWNVPFSFRRVFAGIDPLPLLLMNMHSLSLTTELLPSLICGTKPVSMWRNQSVIILWGRVGTTHLKWWENSSGSPCCGGFLSRTCFLIANNEENLDVFMKVIVHWWLRWILHFPHPLISQDGLILSHSNLK